MEFYDFPCSIWDVIPPIDELIFFRGVGIPPISKSEKANKKQLPMVEISLINIAILGMDEFQQTTKRQYCIWTCLKMVNPQQISGNRCNMMEIAAGMRWK
jgi:hypothetical protein